MSEVINTECAAPQQEKAPDSAKVSYEQFIRKYYAQSEELQQERVLRFARATEVLHAALGLAGEVGEVVDLIKKDVAYGKSIPMDKFVEELGDVLHYLCRLCDFAGINLNILMQANVEKLEKRYQGGYSNEAAIAQADKIGG
jgi:NTP pyrophosphatase (non-canonical NTP hydrolase)